MSITAVSSDGVNHIFPDGTSSVVIGNVMKQYAAAHSPKPAAGIEREPSELASFGVGVGKSLVDTGLGTAQLVGEALIPPTPWDKTDPGSIMQKALGEGITSIDAAAQPYHDANPISEDAGQIVGQIPGVVGPEMGFGDLATAATWLGRMKKAARIGTEVGSEGAIDPTKQGESYWIAKAKQVGENVAGSVAVGGGGDLVLRGANYLTKGIADVSHSATDAIFDWMKRNDPDSIRTQAAAKVAARIAQDEKGGGPRAQDIIDMVRKGQDAGVPTTLLEAGGSNVKSLAGSVARTKGPAKQIIENSFKERLGGARQRLLGSVAKNFNAPETMRQVRGALNESQMRAARPLYEKAFRPGSLAPLKQQFEKAFTESNLAKTEAEKTLTAAQQAVKKAAAKVGRWGKVNYDHDAAKAELERAEANLADAQHGVDAAEKLHATNEQHMEAAKAAHAAGDRGGVWSPHIGRLIQNSDIKKGINVGLHIIRNEADARNEPFNPSDYAITGYDEKGEPVVSKVPNMRVLDAGKRGLDKILEDFRNPITGRLELDQYGRSVDELRRALLSEMDRINPDYKPARQVWAGPAASKGAMAQGTKILTMHPEDVKAIFDHMSPGEQEHFKIGAAQAYLDAIGHKGVIASQVRELAEEDTASMARQRLLPIFKNQSQLDEFITAVEGERGIYNAKQGILAGSQTAARTAEDTQEDWEAGIHAAHGATHILTGNPIGAARSFLAARRNLGMIQNPALNAEIARILSDPQTDIAGIINGTPPKDIPAEPTEAATPGRR